MAGLMTRPNVPHFGRVAIPRLHSMVAPPQPAILTATGESLGPFYVGLRIV